MHTSMHAVKPAYAYACLSIAGKENPPYACLSNAYTEHLRSALAASSPVFEAAFTSMMQQDESATYEIQDSTPEAVEAMLCFIYTGEQPGPDLLAPVFNLAMMYELDSLAKITSPRFAGEVSLSNVKTFIDVLQLWSNRSAVAAEAFEAMLLVIREAPTSDMLKASFVAV